MQLHPRKKSDEAPWHAWEYCQCNLCLLQSLRMQTHGLALVELGAGILRRHHPEYSRGASLMEALRICYPSFYDEALATGVSPELDIRAWRSWLRDRFVRAGRGRNEDGIHNNRQQ